MAEETRITQFRTALNGFNRADVAAYIEEISLAHRTQMQQLRRDLDAARQRIAELEQAAQAAPQETPAPAASDRDWAAEELAAYRRAEAMERAAAARAEVLSRQVTQVLSGALDRFGAAGGEAEALVRTLDETLDSLRAAVARMRSVSDETHTEIEQLRLIEPDEDGAAQYEAAST